MGAQGSSIEKHLQDYLISLYNEMVPQEQWERVEKRVADEPADAAREAEERTVYTAFHVREHGRDRLFAATGGEEFLDVAKRLRRHVRDDNASEHRDFMSRFSTARPITRERFDELTVLRTRNTGKVAGAFEIDLDAGWFSAVHALDSRQTFEIRDVSAAVYFAVRNPYASAEEQWEIFFNHLDRKEINPETFLPGEIGGVRPMEQGDILCIDGPFPDGRELKFRLNLSSYVVQKDVLNLMVDCSKPENSLEITCAYDAARQGVGNKMNLILRQKNGRIRHDFYYPLMEEERALLLQTVELFCQQQTGKSLNDYYAQIDFERSGDIPKLTGGSRRLPMDAVNFSDEIMETDGRMNFYIPVNFDPDAIFGTHVGSASNDDWLNVYADFDCRTGQISPVLSVYLVCADGHEFAFSYPLTLEEQGILRDKMDAYCRQQTGLGLEESSAALLHEQAENASKIQM